jgi:hypothetical protein
MIRIFRGIYVIHKKDGPPKRISQSMASRGNIKTRRWGDQLNRVRISEGAIKKEDEGKILNTK